MDTSPWTLRELFAAVRAKREEYWENKSYEIAWLINSRPTFGKRRRPSVHPNRINPYRRRQRRGIPLTVGNSAAEAALDAWAARAAKTRKP